MATLTIKITHIAWRDGRPRFVPGPKLRKLGFKGQDLRTSSGAWMNAEEALAYSKQLDGDIAARRAAKASGKRAPLRKAQGPQLYTVAALFEDWFASPRLKGEEIVDGRRRQRGLSAASIKDYKWKSDTLLAFDVEFAAAPVEALQQRHVYDLYERLWSARGIATAVGCIRTLSAAISWGIKRGKTPRLAANPALKLGMESPDARIRVATPAELRALVAAADRLERPEIGDAIVLAVWTGQRQKDRLELIDAGLLDGRRLFRQGKTGQIVEIKQAPELEARLAAAALRRKPWPVQPLHLIVNEQSRERFGGDHYRHLFAAVRAEAAKTMPSVKTLRDQDLRDTAVTWLARAGCTIMEVVQITGHSLASATQVLRHYLSQHREVGDNAMAKMIAWWDEQEQPSKAAD